MVMVDEVQQWPTQIPAFRSGFCHLTATSVEELHAFADRLGLRREWFQDHRLAPHYDLTIEVRSRAIALGAVVVRAREQARVRRAARAARADR